MSNTTEAADNDSYWFRYECIQRGIALDDDKEESFIERVCIKVADRINEMNARIDSFNEIFGDE